MAKPGTSEYRSWSTLRNWYDTTAVWTRISSLNETTRESLTERRAESPRTGKRVRDRYSCASEVSRPKFPRGKRFRRFVWMNNSLRVWYRGRYSPVESLHAIAQASAWSDLNS